MAKKNGGDIHTVPNGSGWSNKQNGKVVSNHHKKENAVNAGRNLAKANQSEHFIHKMNGQFGERNSYGNDPHPPKDKR